MAQRMLQDDVVTRPDLPLLPERRDTIDNDNPRRVSGLHRRDTASRLLPADAHFLQLLQSAGLVGELDIGSLHLVSPVSHTLSAAARRLDLLELYYEASGHLAVSKRRRVEDRFFIQHTNDPDTASKIVERLSALTPELGELVLDRIGHDNGLLVLRSGDHCLPVIDEYEEGLDTGEIDLRLLEDNGVPTITVRALVYALNQLLRRLGVKPRLVELKSDQSREAFIGLRPARAMELYHAGFLEDETPDELLEFAGW